MKMAGFNSKILPDPNGLYSPVRALDYWHTHLIQRRDRSFMIKVLQTTQISSVGIWALWRLKTTQMLFTLIIYMNIGD